MPFNEDKCQVLQVGTRNKKFDYEMCGVKIKSVHSFKDLGVTLKSVQCVKDLVVKIASNLKFSQQCIDAANKANRMLGFIKKKKTFYLRKKMAGVGRKTLTERAQATPGKV